MTTELSLNSWDVKEEPIFVGSNRASGFKGLVRSDNGNLLNICTSAYTPITNARFLEMAEQMSSITGYPIELTTEVKGGKKTLAFLKCTQPLTVDKYEFKDYLMLGNSHDGSTGLFIGNSNIMVRCENRFAKSFRQFQVYHSKNAQIKTEELMKHFQAFIDLRKIQYNNFEKFTKVEIDETLKDSLIQRLVKMTNEEKLGTVELSTRKSNIITNINASIERECNDVGYNLFGLFNGVTHYTTHVASNSDGGSYNLFNSCGVMNQDAYKFCLELV